MISVQAHSTPLSMQLSRYRATEPWLSHSIARHSLAANSQNTSPDHLHVWLYEPQKRKKRKTSRYSYHRNQVIHDQNVEYSSSRDGGLFTGRRCANQHRVRLLTPPFSLPTSMCSPSASLASAVYSYISRYSVLRSSTVSSRHMSASSLPIRN